MGRLSERRKVTKKQTIHNRNSPVTVSFTGHPAGVMRQRCQLTYPASPMIIVSRRRKIFSMC
jgi:hypothetical protein